MAKLGKRVEQKFDIFFTNYNKKTKLYFLVAAFGVLAFLLVAGTATFNSQLFSQLFQKPVSHAATSFPTISVTNKWATDLAPNAYSYQEANYDAKRNQVLFYPYGSITAPTGNSGVLLSYKVSGHSTDFTKNSSWQTADIAQILNKPSAVDFGGGFLDDQDNFAYLPPGQKVDASVSATAVTVKVDLAKQYANPNDPTAYQSIDLRSLPSVPSVGSFSGVFANGYAYFTPTIDSKSGLWHGVLIRYDSTKSFSDPNSWQWFNLNSITSPADSSLGGMQSIAYMAPYVYLIPFLNGSVAPGGQINMASKIVRYDTTKGFQNATSYQTLDLTTLPFPIAIQSQLKGFTGGVVVGNKLVLVPWGSRNLQQTESVALIFDTTKNLTDPTAWQYIDLTTVDPNAGGYQEGWIDKDGFVFFVPTHNYSPTVNRAPPLVAWNSTLAFNDPTSWKSYGYLQNIWSTGAAYDPTTNTTWLAAYGQNSSPQAFMTQIQENPTASATMSIVSTQTTPVNPTASFSAQIKVRTDTDAANLFTAKLTFPPNLLQVQGISKTGSFITSWVDTSYDNTAGTISIIGGVPQPGFETSGTNAILANISFKAVAGTGGLANIAFDTSTGKSAIFRNLDNMNILSSTTPLALTINPVSSPSPSPTALPFLNFCNCAGKNPRIKNISAVQGGARAHFSYNNSQMVFDRPTTSGFYEVSVANTSNPLNTAVNITQPTSAKTAQGLPSRNHSDATFSPSGQFIIFKAEADNHYLAGQPNPNGNGFDPADPGYGGFSDLWATDPTGTKFWKLTNYSIKQLASDSLPIKGTMDPTFSDDGKTLYWAESTQPNGVANPNWVIKSASFNVDGNGVPSLSNNQGVLVYDPSTMATLTGQNPLYVNVMGYLDSDTLLIAGNPTGLSQFGMDEYLLHISSHSLTNLTNSPNDWDEGSDLTANKRAVVYMTNKDSIYTFDRTKADWHSQLMQRDYDLVNIDGSGRERLTYFNDPTAPEYIGHNALVIDPAISPDGKYLLANVGIDFSATSSPTRNYQFELVLLTLEANFPAPVVTPTSTPSPTASPTTAPTATPTLAPTATPTPSPTPAPVACSLTSGIWSNLSTNPVTAGASANLTVNSIGDCSGKTVSFVVSQDNGILPASSVTTNPLSGIFIGNTATSSWTSEYQPDGPFGIFDPPEYYFRATLTSSTTGTSSVKSSNPELQVNKSTGSTTPIVSGPGDGNGDGVVNLTDLSVMLSNFTKVSTQPDFPTGLDINTDGIINSLDFASEISLLRSNGSI